LRPYTSIIFTDS